MSGRYRARTTLKNLNFTPYYADQNQLDGGVSENFQNNICYSNSLSNELEIGCGNGHFIAKKAIDNPSVNYFANEIRFKIIVKAIQKIVKSKLNNVFFLRGDIIFFINLLPDSFFNAIYVNFPDPWLKNRYRKRRIINNENLKIFYSKLNDAGKIYFVTDNMDYLNHSREEFKNAGLFTPVFENFGYAGQLDDYPESLYESIFRKQNIPIYYTVYNKK
ncbi:MAG TPA: tRNA (guanosine(46)-N7)-methyltransferase TrmB [bacterium]|nr:tRNA (guanosine(46)-N7)-methyltransferase TrmB [bacterium]HPN31253.1 tRNA (guanosine(46)-N7)-methyltransferase TrmB [bacterium]